MTIISFPISVCEETTHSSRKRVAIGGDHDDNKKLAVSKYNPVIRQVPKSVTISLFREN